MVFFQLSHTTLAHGRGVDSWQRWQVLFRTVASHVQGRRRSRRRSRSFGRGTSTDSPTRSTPKRVAYRCTQSFLLLSALLVSFHFRHQHLQRLLLVLHHRLLTLHHLHKHLLQLGIKSHSRRGSSRNKRGLLWWRRGTLRNLGTRSKEVKVFLSSFGDGCGSRLVCHGSLLLRACYTRSATM